MGTDIHVVVEGRDENGKWVCLNPIRKAFRGIKPHVVEFEELRNYEFFDRLCGVRGEETKSYVPIVKKLGLPEDVSDETRLALSSHDYHSHGFCHFGTFVYLVNEVHKYDERYFRSLVEEGILKAFDWDDRAIDSLELRVVFAFDS